MDSEEKKKVKNQSDNLYKLCLNRKIQNFQALKQWDQARANQLIIHRKIADEIEEVLQIRINQSNQFLRVVIQYLSDVENQFKKHELQSVVNPQTKLKSNITCRNIQVITSKSLIRLYNTIENRKEEKKILALLEESIKKIENILNQSNLDIMDVRTKIEMKIVAIQNQNCCTIEKCQEVLGTYNRDRQVKVFYTETDFFFIQQLFLGQTVKQTRTQEEFGLLIVDFLSIVEKYQKVKLETVREILQKYLVALEEASQTNENIKSLLDILEKRTEDEILQAFYSSQELISQEMMKDLRKVQSMGENQKMDLRVIKKYLTKIPYFPFDDRNLILKEYKTYLKLGDELENSYLIVTVDAFLHIYQYKDLFQLQELHPQYSFKCNNSLQMKKQGDVNMCFEVKKWQLGNFTKQAAVTFSVVFLSEDQREEFREFVSKIIV